MSIDWANVMSVAMLRKKMYIYLITQTNSNCCTLDNPITSLSTCLLGALICMGILFKVLRSHNLSTAVLVATSASWVQPTVTFPIGDHVNVLHDYKKT